MPIWKLCFIICYGRKRLPGICNLIIMRNNYKHATSPKFRVDCSVLTFNGKPLIAPSSQRKEIELQITGHGIPYTLSKSIVKNRLKDFFLYSTCFVASSHLKRMINKK